MLTLKDGTTTTDPRLDRLVQFDEQSRAFPIRAALPARPVLRSRAWPLRWRLDQGREGACVCFGLTHNRVGSPHPASRLGRTTEVLEQFARERYHRAQQLDEWPGEEPRYSGTSLLAGCKAFGEADALGEYRWAFGIDDVLATLAEFGPVVFATDWHGSMHRPRPSGLLDVEGRPTGGHAYSVRGLIVDPSRSSVLRGERLREPVLVVSNSWGDSWGRRGDAYLRASDADRLLKAQGEAVVPLDRPLTS